MLGDSFPAYSTQEMSLDVNGCIDVCKKIHTYERLKLKLFLFLKMFLLHRYANYQYIKINIFDKLT